MRKPWKTIVGFALLGLGIAAVCYAFAATHDYSKPWTGIHDALLLVSIVLCPPQLIFAFCIDCEVVGWNGVIQYVIIEFFNVTLYAAIGAVIVGLRKKAK